MIVTTPAVRPPLSISVTLHFHSFAAVCSGGSSTYPVRSTRNTSTSKISLSVIRAKAWTPNITFSVVRAICWIRFSATAAVSLNSVKLESGVFFGGFGMTIIVIVSFLLVKLGGSRGGDSFNVLGSSTGAPLVSFQRVREFSVVSCTSGAQGGLHEINVKLGPGLRRGRSAHRTITLTYDAKQFHRFVHVRCPRLAVGNQLQIGPRPSPGKVKSTGGSTSSLPIKLNFRHKQDTINQVESIAWRAPSVARFGL